jgi:hypothetical protein
MKLETQPFKFAQFVLEADRIVLNANPLLPDGTTLNLKTYFNDVDWDGVWTYLRPSTSNTIFTVRSARKKRKLEDIAETLVWMGAEKVDAF